MDRSIPEASLSRGYNDQWFEPGSDSPYEGALDNLITDPAQNPDLSPAGFGVVSALKDSVVMSGGFRSQEIEASLLDCKVSLPLNEVVFPYSEVSFPGHEAFSLDHEYFSQSYEPFFPDFGVFFQDSELFFPKYELFFPGLELFFPLYEDFNPDAV